MFGVMEFVWEENAGAKLRDQPDYDDVCFQEYHSNDCSRHKRKKPRMTWFPFVEKMIKKGTQNESAFDTKQGALLSLLIFVF